ncbi:MAG TPA: cytochrome c biogenesis protein CcsA [Pirellulaceae bacterium]|nr:cytochrome c biogenesis protein CcsA [Pirellulaceae bacterium]
MLSGISIVCFSASYTLALLLEVSRLFFRAPVRLVVILLLTAAGLGAHTIYLWNRAQSASPELPLSTWYDWYLVAAWVLAATYLGMLAVRPMTSVGVFALPMVLLLVAVAYAFQDVVPFPRDRALQSWGLVHGAMLLIGTVTVTFGFVAGVMYLVQSYRLKHKLPPREGLRLPSLEWLQTVNKQSLWYSAWFIALGLIAGIILNAIKSSGEGPAVPWTDVAVISSAVLLFWLIAASLFEWLYKPAQQGRKVAYLTVASFVFLTIVMFILLTIPSKHARPRSAARSRHAPCVVANGRHTECVCYIAQEAIA